MLRGTAHGVAILCALLAVLAGMCAPSLGARAPEDATGSAGASSRDYLPLAPWLEGLEAKQDLPACIVLNSSKWGIGSSFNNLIWTAAILRQQRPDITLYYDHSLSSYQCSPDSSVTAILRPAKNIIRTAQPPKNCVTWVAEKLVSTTETFLMTQLGGIITESLRQEETPITSRQQGLQRHLLLGAMFQALCPVVNDWWHLMPDVQARADAVKQQLHSRQQPVIAIHARGGDKNTELGKYSDPVTHQYPMAEGMRRLTATHPGIHGSSPTCVIFGDDHKYAETVRGMAQDILKCGEVVMRTPKQQNAAYKVKEFRQQALHFRCEATKDYLVDIELMGWADFMVANHRANADTTATFLRKCKFHHDYATVVPGTGAPRFTLWAR